MRDRVTGDPRGFAFVIFRDASTVDLVMNEPKHEINHKIVDVKRAQARGVAPPSIHEKQGDGGNEGGGGNEHGHGHGRRGGGDGGHQRSRQSDQSQNKVFVGGKC